LLQPFTVLNKVLDPAARYDPQGFTWVGWMSPSPTFGVSWHTAPVRSIAQVRETKLTLAAGGPLGPAWMVPQALNRLAGTPPARAGHAHSAGADAARARP
jgi:hypothetical protein